MHIQAHYLGSILIERNRWKGGAERVPSIDLAQLAPAIQAAGFDGLELWDRHFLMGTAAQREFLCSGQLPVRIYNSYWLPYAADSEDARAARDAVRALSHTLHGIKFNFGKPGEDLRAQIATLKEWAAELPDGVQLLCECHDGSLVETPEQAAAILDQFDAAQLGFIVHPLSFSYDMLERWFELCGPRVRHLHIQNRDRATKRWEGVDFETERVHHAIATLRRHGYSGTATFEFTRGTNTADDTPPTLLRNAANDLRHWKAATLAG